MTKFGQDLIQAAHEAVAIAEGRLQPARVVEPATVDVAAVRRRLGLSQAAFAARFGLPLATIRDWEQGRRKPDGAAVVLIRVIDHAPDAVAGAVAGS